MTDSPFTKLIEFLPSRHTYTETEVRLVMAGMQAEIDRAEAERDALRAQRDTALRMLASWCVDVDTNGASWDDWDENYKAAMYRPGPLRELLDEAIAAEREGRAQEQSHG